MDLPYPAGPAAVPARLTAPTLQYRLRAWMALAGLLVFVGVYLALVGWFGWTAWRLFAGLLNGPDNALGFVIAGTGAAFLAVFLLKALLFVRKGAGTDGIEITAQEQPRLFAFLHRLADEAGAPRPRRVYLTGNVNAAVFYDLSVINLLIPSRKNLEIGLALVNVLTLGELKAVLAHELGHFAQRGEEVSRKALPRVIEAVEEETQACALRIREHDQRCRSAHLAAAPVPGRGLGHLPPRHP